MGRAWPSCETFASHYLYVYIYMCIYIYIYIYIQYIHRERERERDVYLCIIIIIIIIIIIGEFPVNIWGNSDEFLEGRGRAGKLCEPGVLHLSEPKF